MFKYSSYSGFSLLEILFAISLMAILTSIALPNFIEWQKKMDCKQAAKEVSNALKTARSKAITQNQLHGVRFDEVNKSYKFAKFSSSQWVLYSNYSTAGRLPKKVALSLNTAAAAATAPTPNIHFDINGSSFGNYSVWVSDSGSNKYTVSVTRTGRVKVK